MKRLIFVACLGAAGCLRDTTVPPPDISEECATDGDCTKGVCDANLKCDKTKCHVDASCENNACVGGSATIVGHCKLEGCKTNADCGTGQRCATNAAGDTLCQGGCDTDADCKLGICEATLCNEGRCHNNGQCKSMVCKPLPGFSYGNCAIDACTTNSDCAPNEQCIRSSLTGNKVCLAGGNCIFAADCPGPCDTCAGGNGFSTPGTCMTGEAGPRLNGDAGSLKMIDNLQQAIAFVRQRDPGAYLTQIGGNFIQGDGTTDLTGTDDRPGWFYGFQVGDGGTAPPRMVTVTYHHGNGTTCGLYNRNASNISPRDGFDEADIPLLKDATQLVPAFEALPNCAAPVGDVQDNGDYNVTNGAPRFLLNTWKGQQFTVHAVTGAGTATCQ